MDASKCKGSTTPFFAVGFGAGALGRLAECYYFWGKLALRAFITRASHVTDRSPSSHHPWHASKFSARLGTGGLQHIFVGPHTEWVIRRQRCVCIVALNSQGPFCSRSATDHWCIGWLAIDFEIKRRKCRFTDALLTPLPSLPLPPAGLGQAASTRPAVPSTASSSCCMCLVYDSMRGTTPTSQQHLRHSLQSTRRWFPHSVRRPRNCMSVRLHLLLGACYPALFPLLQTSFHRQGLSGMVLPCGRGYLLVFFVRLTLLPSEYRDNNEYTTTGKPDFAVHARINHVSESHLFHPPGTFPPPSDYACLLQDGYTCVTVATPTHSLTRNTHMSFALLPGR